MNVTVFDLFVFYESTKCIKFNQDQDTGVIELMENFIYLFPSVNKIKWFERKLINLIWIRLQTIAEWEMRVLDSFG